jgi:hypothetical protein
VGLKGKARGGGRVREMSWCMHVLVFELELVLLTGGRALLLLVRVCIGGVVGGFVYVSI